MTTKQQLSQVDREAVTRAIELKRARSPADRREVDEMLKTNAWFEVAEDAVYCCQRSLIAPRLWQPTVADIPPDQVEAIIARGDDGLAGNYAAAKLLRRMLKAGLSKYEPQVLQKLAEAKARRFPEAPTAA